VCVFLPCAAIAHKGFTGKIITFQHIKYKIIRAFINGWETWEPKDKSKKDAIKTYWSLEEEKISSEKNVPQE
jgi:hypothetical protein